MPENRPMSVDTDRPEPREDAQIVVVREVLIDATDIIEPGTEPYPGWSFVLAERIVRELQAVNARG